MLKAPNILSREKSEANQPDGTEVSSQAFSTKVALYFTDIYLAEQWSTCLRLKADIESQENT